MPTDVIIDPSTGQIYWNDSTGSPQSISIKGDAQNAISFVGYSGSFSPGSSPAGASTLVTVNDNSGTDALVPGTSGFNLGSSTLRWNTFATNANLSGTLVVSDSTISSSLLTGSVRFNGGIAISGNASIGQSLNFYNTSNANYVGFKAGVTAANTLYTLPTAFPGSGTSVLQSTSAGVMSWVPLAASASGGTVYNGNVAQLAFYGATGNTVGGASGVTYNPTSGLFYITHTTASTSTTTGALVVVGGVGIGGSLSVGSYILLDNAYGSVTTTPFASIFAKAIGSNATSLMQVKGNDGTVGMGIRALTGSNSLIYSNGQIDFRVGSTIRDNDVPTGGTTHMTLGTTGILTLSASIASTTTSTGALVVTGGVGIGGSLYVASATAISGVTINNGVITGNLTGTATTATNVNVNLVGNANVFHSVLLTPTISSAGSAISGNGTLTYNALTDILSTPGLAVTSGAISTSTTSGAFQVKGGIGITGNAFIGGTINVGSPITIPNGGTNASSFGQSGGFVYYDGTSLRLLAASGATINYTNGYYQFDNRVYATSFFAGGNQMPNGSGIAGRVTIWSGNNTIGSDAEFTYDSTNNILNVSGNINAIGFTASGVAITSGTASTSTTTGALVVAGGVGISGRLTFNLASFGTTGITTVPTMAMIGQTGDPIYMSVLEDNSISFEGSQGQLFSISPNLTTGYIWAVNDISGVPLLRSSVGGTIGIAEFGGVVGIGQTNPTYKLDLKGSFGLASSNDSLYNFIFSNSAASGSNSLQIRSANSILLYNSGNTFYTGFKSRASADKLYLLPATDGSSGQFLQTDGDQNLTWATATGGGGGSGATGVNPGGQYQVGYYASTGASIDGSSTFTNNTSTGVISIGHATVSTSISSGALQVSGGVGIGGSLYVGGTGSSISGLRIASGTITAGTWNGTIISTVYGGTGLNLTGLSGILTVSSGTVSASTTSSAISSALSDETGSGSLVFGTQPSFGTGVTTGSATFAVFNTNATTINAFGAATAISLGASTGTATFNSTNNTTAANTGAVVFSGGVGIGKSVSIGGNLLLFNSSTYTGFKSNQVGTGSTVYTLPSTSPATGTSVLQSDSSGVMSWVPMVASGGAGSGTVAIPGAQFQIAAYYHSATGASVSGSSTFTNNTGTAQVAITHSTASTSTSSGALAVSGGLGLAGNAFIGGTINVPSVSTSNISNVLFANGIVTSGTWSGSTITAFYGGTGLQGPSAIGDIIVANSATTWSRYATSSTSGQVLTSNGTGSAPTWEAVPPSAASSVAVAPTTVDASFFVTAVNASNSSGLGLSTITSFVVNPFTGRISLSGLAVTNTTATTTTTSGALVVSGGMGLAGNAFIGGTIYIPSTTASNFSNLLVSNLTASTSTSSGALVVTGGLGLGGNAFIGGTIYVPSTTASNFSNLLVSNNTSSTSTSSGALVVNGGLGIAGNAFIGGTFVHQSTASSVGTNSGSVTLAGGVGIAGNAFIGGTFVQTNSTSSVGTNSGSMSIAGGVGIAGNAFIGGTTTITNTTASVAANSGALVIRGGVGIGQSVSVGGSLNIFNGANYSGFRFAGSADTTYTLPSRTPTGTATSYLSSSIDGVMAWVAAPTSGGSGSVNSGTATYAAFYATTTNSVSENANLQFTGTGVSIGGLIQSTSTTSGALYIRGGVGITGNAFIGGTAYIPSTTPSNISNLLVSNNTATTTTTSGALVVSGGLGLAGNAFIGGTIYIPSTTASNFSNLLVSNNTSSTSTSTGALVSAGGLGIAGNAFIGGTFVHQSTTSSVGTNSGSVTLAGGIGIAGNAFIGGTFVQQNSTSSVGTNSGAITVVGGVGIAGNAFIGGTTTIQSTQATLSASSGAMVVIGGAAIGQTLSIGGSLNIFNAANYTGFRFAGSANTTYTLPPRTPTGTGTSYLSSSIDGVMAWVAAPTGGSATPGGSNKQIQFNNSSAFGGAAGFEFTTGGIANTVSIFSASGTGYTAGLWIHAINGTTTRVGIGLSNPAFELEILGEISATNKSFVIDHPTKSGMKLRYGSLEGPENGVYVRGELKNLNLIEVPDHWIGLVHEDSYTVHLTPIGRYAQLYVEKIENYNVYVADANMNPIHCYYSIWAERKDIPKLITEYEAQ
jgi:hypothetical protein